MRPPSPRVVTVLAAIALGLLVARAVAVAWVCDDAFITFRTVDHVLQGHGPRWNGADRVQAYTHPLWMLLLAAATAVTHDPYRTAIGLGVLLSAAAAIVLLRGAARSPVHGAGAVALLVLSPSFADYATSGLENPLVHLWLALFWTGFLTSANEPLSGRSFAPLQSRRTLCVLAGLAACTRLDAIVILLPALVWALLRMPRRRALAAVAWGAVPVVAWHAFAAVYYGTLLPNSALAKLTHGFGFAALLPKGIDYLASTWVRDPVSLVAIAVALGAATRRGMARERAAAAGILLHLAYVVGVGGDFMGGRFVTGCTLTAAAIWARVPWRLPHAAALAALAVGAALVAPGSPLRPIPDVGARVERTIDARGIADERRFYAPLTSWRAGRGRAVWPDPATATMVSEARRNWLADPFVALLQQIHLVAADEALPAGADQAVAAGRARPVVLVPAVGTFGWYARDGLHIVDLYGLGDPLLARLPALRPDPLLGRFAPRLAALGWRQGHFIRRLPEGYFATLLTGDNHLRDPDLARYWDDVALVTRAPLFAPGRWAAIVRLARGGRDPRLARARDRSASGAGGAVR
jgi:arabinofuranosyltransferase